MALAQSPSGTNFPHTDVLYRGQGLGPAGTIWRWPWRYPGCCTGDEVGKSLDAHAVCLGELDEIREASREIAGW